MSRVCASKIWMYAILHVRELGTWIFMQKKTIRRYYNNIALNRIHSTNMSGWVYNLLVYANEWFNIYYQDSYALEEEGICGIHVQVWYWVHSLNPPQYHSQWIIIVLTNTIQTNELLSTGKKEWTNKKKSNGKSQKGNSILDYAHMLVVFNEM